VRQEQLKVLAAKADARWAAKPSFLDAPTRQQPLPATEVNHPGAYGGELEEGGKGEMNAVTWAADEPQGKRSKIEGGTVIGDEGAEEVRRVANQKPQLEKRGRVKEQKEKEDPWKQARGGPSEEWQPQAWSGGTAARRG
jgi:NADH dehydrogenase [ubiquinone] 1 alpha subcomplex assembly factor 2